MESKDISKHGISLIIRFLIDACCNSDQFRNVRQIALSMHWTCMCKGSFHAPVILITANIWIFLSNYSISDGSWICCYVTTMQVPCTLNIHNIEINPTFPLGRFCERKDFFSQQSSIITCKISFFAVDGREWFTNIQLVWVLFPIFQSTNFAHMQCIQ